MTTSVLNLEKMWGELSAKGLPLGPRPVSANQEDREIKSLSGRELVKRLSGTLTLLQADELERHINESCEREND